MIRDPGYYRWVADHLWYKGLHLFTDGTEEEVKRVAFLMSINSEVLIRQSKFKGTEVHLLYTKKNQFPFIPSMYFYTAIDHEEGAYLYLSDAVQASKNNEAIP